MRLARLLGSLVVLVVVLTIGLDVADACGTWTLTDTQRKIRVVEHISTANFYSTGGKHLGRYWMVEAAGGLRASDGRRVVVDLADGAILYRGRRAGRIDGDQVTIGRKTFTIELSNPHEVHGMPSYDVVVKVGDTVIATGEGSSLCAGMHRDPPMTADEEADEVRRRVVYYLVWRERGRGR